MKLPDYFNSPIDGYAVCNEDSGADPKYYGFQNAFGEWYILRENTTTKAFRYAAGKSDYSTNWTGRAGLTYQLPADAFTGITP